MKSDVARHVRVAFPEAALTTIFDECDRFERDETGGRLVGTFTEEDGNLTIRVTGVIEPGPQAQRTAVSFFQDGAYQEGVFRQIERQHPRVEHLGNWHTHHVNGLSTLSGGDVTTYHRTVNHPNHNTSFFYALLVTAKHRTSDPRRRYSLRHFLFRRGDERFFEVPRRNVEIVDTPLIWPQATPGRGARDGACAGRGGAAPRDRFYDHEAIQELYPGIRPFASKTLGVHWRGDLELLDGSRAGVVVLEEVEGAGRRYSVLLREPPPCLREVAEDLTERVFSSARVAIVNAERACNRALFQAHVSRRTI